METNILVHGNSEGYNSEFMQYIAKHLYQSGKKVFGFDFKYINKDSEPSKNLEKELEQLKGVIQEHKNRGYNSINLIGKSLGGTICLNTEIVNDKSVKNIFIVGFPIILGFPANLSLLKNKPVQNDPEAIDMYRKLFKKLGQNVKKITIIQGKDDLLGDKKTIQSSMSSLSVKPKILFVENASHGFKPINDSKNLEQNMNEIVDIILSKI